MSAGIFVRSYDVSNCFLQDGLQDCLLVKVIGVWTMLSLKWQSILLLLVTVSFLYSIFSPLLPPNVCFSNGPSIWPLYTVNALHII